MVKMTLAYKCRKCNAENLARDTKILIFYRTHYKCKCGEVMLMRSVKRYMVPDDNK